VIELSRLAPFLLGSLIITVVPGADMALVTRQVLRGGRRLAHRTIVGNLAGLVVHGGACAAGLSALLVASATAYTAVRLAGAAYLIFLAIQASGTEAISQRASLTRAHRPAGWTGSPARRRRASQARFSTLSRRFSSWRSCLNSPIRRAVTSRCRLPSCRPYTS